MRSREYGRSPAESMLDISQDFNDLIFEKQLSYFDEQGKRVDL